MLNTIRSFVTMLAVRKSCLTIRHIRPTRVSDFLEPNHFFEPIHQQVYDIARSLIRAGKVASPVTLKTFLPADVSIAGFTPGRM